VGALLPLILKGHGRMTKVSHHSGFCPFRLHVLTTASRMAERVPLPVKHLLASAWSWHVVLNTGPQRGTLNMLRSPRSTQ
jgi:hypothetical protein